MKVKPTGNHKQDQIDIAFASLGSLLGDAQKIRKFLMGDKKANQSLDGCIDAITECMTVVKGIAE